MNRQQLDELQRWFSGYCRTFYSANDEDQKNITLKEDHTHRVCDNMRAIVQGLGLEASRALLAETIALLHDVGRFPQYQRYKTFKDNISENHGTLGVSVLEKNKVLDDLSAPERGIILRAVNLHNVFSVPAGLDEETLLFVKMIRDADKLDIWRVFIDYYGQGDAGRPNAAGLGLPDVPDYSREVLASLLRKEMVHLSSLRTLNDFKLLQLAWIFDLNFRRSLQLVLERAYIDRIAGTLPRSADIARAVDSIRDYAERAAGTMDRQL